MLSSRLGRYQTDTRDPILLDAANGRIPSVEWGDDRGRVLNTTAFRRLGGITQVFAADMRSGVHNRLTHVLEVAHVGRMLGDFLRRHPTGQPYQDIINIDVIETACLCHDLGHPCFGHVAEKELHRLAQASGLDDGFEGNAQSFRIITKLAVCDPKTVGLNLTRATLNAVLKYPWLHSMDSHSKASKNWGAYSSEKDIFDWCRDKTGLLPGERSLEAQIMDWADDIAYSIHDFEDYYVCGLINPQSLCDDSVGKSFISSAEFRAKDRQEPWTPAKKKSVHRSI